MVRSAWHHPNWRMQPATPADRGLTGVGDGNDVNQSRLELPSRGERWIGMDWDLHVLVCGEPQQKGR